MCFGARLLLFSLPFRCLSFGSSSVRLSSLSFVCVCVCVCSAYILFFGGWWGTGDCFAISAPVSVFHRYPPHLDCEWPFFLSCLLSLLGVCHSLCDASAPPLFSVLRPRAPQRITHPFLLSYGGRPSRCLASYEVRACSRYRHFCVLLELQTVDSCCLHLSLTRAFVLYAFFRLRCSPAFSRRSGGGDDELSFLSRTRVHTHTKKSTGKRNKAAAPERRSNACLYIYIYISPHLCSYIQLLPGACAEPRSFSSSLCFRYVRTPLRHFADTYACVAFMVFLPFCARADSCGGADQESEAESGFGRRLHGNHSQRTCFRMSDSPCLDRHTHTHTRFFTSARGCSSPAPTNRS